MLFGWIIVFGTGQTQTVFGDQIRCNFGRTGDIAHTLGVKVTSLGPVRAKLIKKGMKLPQDRPGEGQELLLGAGEQRHPLDLTPDKIDIFDPQTQALRRPDFSTFFGAMNSGGNISAYSIIG